MIERTGEIMEIENKIVFEITGKDFENLQRFREQHKDCARGMAGDQFTYSFVPTGLGVAGTVECSCGQTLSVGDFMDREEEEYDENEHPVLTEADRKNQVFEEAALVILRMRDPRWYRMAFLQDQSFEMIYNVSVYGIAQFSDERIYDCVLWKYDRDEYGMQVGNYEDMNENEKINTFFEYFIDHVRAETEKYSCRNEELLRILNDGGYVDQAFEED